MTPELTATLQAGPPVPTTEAATPSVPPSRWTLPVIRAAVPALAAYSLSGVWRVLAGHDLVRRNGRLPQFSPDPAYATKLATLEACLAEAAAAPGQVELVFLDEMGYRRWPDAGPDWGPAAPAPPPRADRAGVPPRQWRLVGALNAVTGAVTVADDYIIGRRQLGAFYHQLVATYPAATRLYVVQDNWSIHQHPDVLAVIDALPTVEPVWLPTYAPWLNPIEKLWRTLRQEVLRGHRLAGDWAALQARIAAFFAQFATGSAELLHTVGLRGTGRLAEALRVP